MLNNILFYSLEKAIKRYRRFAQANIDRAGIAITIDQWLVLHVILENDDLTQAEIGERVFKDQASVARIIALLTGRDLLAAVPLPHDGRRTQMRVTAEGQRVLDAVQPIVLSNRETALRGLSDADLTTLRVLLERIYTNCTSPPQAPE
ncbi:MarR family winged helix-turn-helix transcriptional regulator [Hymenobacter sp. BT175]|uniref:MarR family winged helix-turn-helix transcriptional regulator n=1 Tax=Hymenobacter translucens TaxID=2886507 RepID=UPI001D0DC856|nr:MarR family winged helix-turn-helix transcriptional regulator [Hymenobacter translucens]MCC2545035.1 MarR family winged helix-turn-helix transcriptional regulator [Hymenobacter translucens]